MPKCPNCGQSTARTKDWACPWCGYPLISKSYKEIPKSYQELRIERQRKWEQTAREETEASLLPPIHVPEPEAEVTSEPEAEPMLEPEAEVTLEPEAEPMLEPEAEVTLEPEPKPTPEPEAEETLEAEAKPIPEPEAEVTLEAEAKPMPEPKAEVILEAEAKPTLEAEAKPTVTTEELYSAYKANAVEADAKYKEKILTVTGTVHKIVTKDTFDIYYVMLASAEKHEKWNVRCTFDKTHELELERLTAGQTVTVQGEYDGYRTNILMRDCTLVG